MGKGGGGPTQTTSTSNTSNIPEYAQPYVETMLGATQKQLYKMDDSGGITGFQPYKAFGGTYDASGKMTGYDAGKALAGFTPAQQQAQQGIMGLQVPGQYGAATNLTNQAALGSMNSAGQAGNLQNQALGYGTAGAQYGGAGAQYGSTGAEQAQRAAALTAAQAGQYGAQGAQAGQQAGNLSDVYGGLGSQAGQTAAGQSGMYGNLGAQSGQQYAGQSSGYGGMGAGYGAQGSQIGQSLGQMSQDPNAVQNYMNPYLQASLNPQLAEIQRQYDITGTQQRSGAAKSGAFGGSREALMSAENQRNAGLAKNQLIGQGYNQAFQQAQQQMNAANQAALSGNAQAMQGAGIGLQGAGQAGSQALAGYGMGLQGAGQAGSQAMQGYGMGLTGANQAGNLRMQGAQAGLQGVGAQQAAANLGLAGTAQGMQGAGMGMQGAQAGMQGVQGAIGAGQYGLSGYGQAGQMAGQLAGIGGQQLAAQQGILTAQNAVGAQQQQLEQQKINQAIQDYANAQQYPIMQLGTMSNMLRGLPMQAQTTQQYQAQANPITQGIGALGAGASLYNATKGAKGGIMSYDVGGSVRAKLEDMPDESLKAQLKSSSSESIKNDIKQILATRNMAGIKQAASGGVLRYAEPNKENNQGVTRSGALTDAAARADYQEAYPGANADRAREEQFLSQNNPVLDTIKNLPLVNKLTGPISQAANSIISKFRQTPEEQAIDFRRASARDAQRQDPTKFVPDNQRRTLESLQGMAPDLREQEQAYFSTDYFDNRNKKLVDPKSILAANSVTPASASPKITTPAGAPAAVATSEGGKKIPIETVKKIAPETVQAMGNKPGPTASVTQDIMNLISEKLGISPRPPVDENAGMTTKQILDRDEKIAKEFAGENPAMARRAQIMAEKTSAADEAKYTQAMRMAEFFAMWGSTPGNTIVAGLNAMKAKIPDFITDKKEATKIRREMDKSIADLDQIDYLEKVGKIDAADKKRTASIKFGIDTWGTQIAKATALTAATVKEITDKEIAANKEIGDTKRNEDRIAGGIKEANIRATATMGAKESPENKEYHKTNDDLVKIERAIEAKVKSNGSLEGDINLIKRYSTRPELTAQQKTRLEDARANVNKELGPLEKQRNILTKKLEGFATKNVPTDSTSAVDPNKRPPLNSFQK